MDDQGINKYLEDNYGRTPEGLPYFRLIWSTNITERRYSEFTDFHGDLFVRTVRETREVLKYPFAQDRWIIERIREIDSAAIELGLRSDNKFSYEEVYIFQDRNGKFLPLSIEMVEAAIFLFFKFYMQMTPKERKEIKTEILANKILERKRENRALIGEGRSPFGFVLDTSRRK